MWTAQVSSEDGDVFESVIAVNIDPFGASVAASHEGCQFINSEFTNCDLHVRKYDSDGNELWEYVESGSGFSDLYRGDLVTDRFGYIYVATTHDGPDGNKDWWIAKIHP